MSSDFTGGSILKNKAIAALEKVYDSFKGNSTRRIKELKKFIAQGKKTGDSCLIGAAYFYLGYIYYEMDDRDAIFSNALKAVALLKDSTEYNLLVRSYIMLGYAYSRQENYQMEFDCYDKAYLLGRKHRIRGNVWIILLNDLSNCYHQLGDYKTAIQIMEECVSQQVATFPEDHTDRAMYMINLSEYYKDDGQPETARKMLEAMGEWIDKVEFDGLICDYYLRLAIISFKLGDSKYGKKYTDTAFGYIPAKMYPHPVYDDLRQISHILVTAGDKKRAGKIHDLMKVYAEKNPGTLEQLIAYRTMAECNARFGDEKLALEYYAKLDDLFEARMDEFRKIQLSVNKKMRAADSEIMKLNRRIEESEELTSKEPLTKLLNRTTLLKVASDFIDTAAKKKEKVGAIFIDIDYFKECNDTYGHVKGDEILKEVAQVCRKEETASVRFARYGGDEFFGITHGLDDKAVAEIARRICARIRKTDIPNEKNPNGHRVTLSVGVVNVPITGHTDTIIEIANYADKAVYYAKNAGKDRIYFLDHGRKNAKGKDDQFVRIEF